MAVSEYVVERPPETRLVASGVQSVDPPSAVANCTVYALPGTLNQVRSKPPVCGTSSVTTGLLSRTDKSSINMVPTTLAAPPEAKFTRSFTAPSGTMRRLYCLSKGEVATLPSQPGLSPSVLKSLADPNSLFAASVNRKLKRIAPFVTLYSWNHCRSSTSSVATPGNVRNPYHWISRVSPPLATPLRATSE